MGRGAIQLFATLALGLSASVATADTAQNVVQECVRQTGAPGAYAVAEKQNVPQVSPAAGGTQAGAARVNDCLLDKYQVQFSAGQIVAANPAAVDPEVAARCAALRQSRLPRSAPLGGTSASAQASQRYQDCIANASASDADSLVLDAGNCGRGSNVFSGGSAYCRD